MGLHSVRAEQEFWIVELPEGPVLTVPWVRKNGVGCPGLISHPVRVIKADALLVVMVDDEPPEAA